MPLKSIECSVRRSAFEPWNLGTLKLKNRIIKAATHDGATFSDMERVYSRLARNEVAMITVAYVAVSERNKTFDNQHAITALNLPKWHHLTSVVHHSGAKIAAQLHHPGLFCMSSDGQPMGPSFGWLPSSMKWPKSMSLADLQEVKAQYATAAFLCREAGFDAIELHCGHGYLLSQFLTPVVNRRSDRYGGSVEKRARFPMEVLRVCCEVTCNKLPVLVKMNLEDGFKRGLNLEASLNTAKLFAKAGATAIVPSWGYTSLNGFGMLRGNVPLAKMVENFPVNPWLVEKLGPYLVPMIEYETLFLREQSIKMLKALHAELDSEMHCQVIYVGGADSFDAIVRVIGEDGFAAVQIGRPLIREPFFVRRLARAAKQTGTVECISKCVRCNMCTLASLNPDIPPGCPFLKDEMDIEEIGPRL